MKFDSLMLKDNIENDLDSSEPNLAKFIGGHIKSALNIDINNVQIKLDPFGKSIKGKLYLNDGMELETTLKFSDEVYTKIEAKFKF